MTREQAFNNCPSDSYVAHYGNHWLIVPYDLTKPSRFTLDPQAGK